MACPPPLPRQRVPGRPTPLNMRASIGAAIAGLLWFNSCGAAQPNKKPYELQERCDKRAADLFEREYKPRVENTKDVQKRFNYEDHYSARLNKCFFLEISSSYDREGGKLTSSKIMRLVELNDNKDYGVFVSGLSDRGPPIACLLEEKICQSESEWRQLLKPFMEN